MTKHYTDEGTLLIRNSDIKDGKFEFGDNPIHLEKLFAEKNETRMHQIGDVITVHTGDVGTSAVITENEAKSIGFATIVTRPNPKIIDSNYLCSYTTVNDLFDLWLNLKRGLKNNTIENYKYLYNTFVRPVIGNKRVSTLRKSDIKKYYNYLADERNLKVSTIDSIHTVLHQILQIAVDDDYIRNNPSDNVLRELKKSHAFQSEKRRALTRPEQDLFLDYLKTHPVYEHWYPVFAVMIGTGLRVGEVTGLRWCDIDMESGMIDVNHTLVYYDHRTEGSKKGCYFNVNTTKTPASMRQVPMLDFVKEAFELEKQKQKDLDIHCEVTIDGYTDFIFINRFGQAQHQATLNKAIRRIIRDCNDEQFEKSEEPEVLLPHFSCHSLRHTFTTRMCEAGVNIKVIQDALGHTDISTTLNIYTDVTKELKTSEFKGLDNYFKAQ